MSDRSKEVVLQSVDETDDAARELPPFPPGEEFGGYVLEKLLGRGGTSEVHRARNIALGTTAAVKILRCLKPSAVERFAREARLLMALSHPSFPRFFTYGSRDGIPFIIIEELERRQLPSSDDDVARLLLSLCGGVAHLHAMGLLHRDIKPANILFRADGTPVLIDFGLIKRMDDVSGKTPVDTTISVIDGHPVAVGTPTFSAPEQFTGGAVTPAADIHALGALANACFDGNPPATWRPIIRQATSSIPHVRYGSVSEFTRAIRHRRLARIRPLAAMAIAALAAAAIWISAAKVNRTPSYLLPAVRELGELAQTRRDGNGHYGYIKLDGDRVVIDMPVRLKRRQRLVIEGPGALQIDISGDRSSRVELRRCALHNSTHEQEASHLPRYVLSGGSLLNFINLPALDVSTFADTFDEEENAVIFSGPVNSLRHFASRLNK